MIGNLFSKVRKSMPADISSSHFEKLRWSSEAPKHELSEISLGPTCFSFQGKEFCYISPSPLQSTGNLVVEKVSCAGTNLRLHFLKFYAMPYCLYGAAEVCKIFMFRNREARLSTCFMLCCIFSLASVCWWYRQMCPAYLCV